MKVIKKLNSLMAEILKPDTPQDVAKRGIECYGKIKSIKFAKERLAEAKASKKQFWREVILEMKKAEKNKEMKE
jgi:hypothetical protein